MGHLGIPNFASPPTVFSLSETERVRQRPRQSCHGEDSSKRALPSNRRDAPFQPPHTPPALSNRATRRTTGQHEHRTATRGNTACHVVTQGHSPPAPGRPRPRSACPRAAALGNVTRRFAQALATLAGPRCARGSASTSAGNQGYVALSGRTRTDRTRHPSAV